MDELYWSKFKEMIELHVKKLLIKWGFFNLYDDGKVAFLSEDGKRANVNINGSVDATQNIPIRQGLELVVGDEVRVLNVNFNKKDRIIDHKKIL